jgi:hypothetical protein
MSENDQHSYRGLKHRTIIEMAKEVGTGKLEAEAAGHDTCFPVPSASQKRTPKGGSKEVKSTDQRGMIYVFVATNEKVTVVRSNVGQTYDGTAAHEVVTRDGHKFLANQKQLRKPV